MSSHITPAQKECRNALNTLQRAGDSKSGQNRKLVMAMKQLAQSIIDVDWMHANVVYPGDYGIVNRPYMARLGVRHLDLVLRPQWGGRETRPDGTPDVFLYFLGGVSHSLILHPDIATARMFAHDISNGWLDSVSEFVTARCAQAMTYDLAEAVLGPK